MEAYICQCNFNKLNTFENMKKIILSGFMMIALLASSSVMAQDNKTKCTKAKTECCATKKACTKTKAECTKTKKECCTTKKACDKTKAECTATKKTCTKKKACAKKACPLEK